MAPKEPTRAQLSSRLSYSQHTPAFLRRLQNQSGGYKGGRDDNDDEYPNDDADPEFEDYDHGSGRPPIPRRPAIPERPPEDPGSAGEDDDDEKPQVVVLKEGKHLTEREAENIRRKVKGLPPLPDPQHEAPPEAKGSKAKDSSTDSKSKKPTLSFSTSGSTSKQTPSAAKRKLEAVISHQTSDDEHDESKRSVSSKKAANPRSTSKKQKKNKTLLSFGDDA